MPVYVYFEDEDSQPGFPAATEAQAVAFLKQTGGDGGSIKEYPLVGEQKDPKLVYYGFDDQGEFKEVFGNSISARKQYKTIVEIGLVE